MYKLNVMIVFLLTIGLFATTVDAAINVAITQGEETDLAKLYSSTDLIQGMIATELPGDLGWHSANTDPLDQLPAFTDGIGARSGLTGLWQSTDSANKSVLKTASEMLHSFISLLPFLWFLVVLISTKQRKGFLLIPPQELS